MLLRLGTLVSRAYGRFPGRARPSDPTSEFHHLQVGGFNWIVRLTSLNDELLTLLANPSDFLQSAQRLEVSGFFLKRYARTKPIELVKSLFEITPAQNAFEMGLNLRAAGFLSPMPVAVGHRRIAGVLLESYLITEKLQDVRELSDWQGSASRMARDLAELVTRLDRNGFVHGDLNLSNMLVDHVGRIHLVDLDTMQYVRVVSEQQSRKQIARMSRKALAHPRVSRTHRVRFLIDYCRLRGNADWKCWWAKIEALNKAKFARVARKAQ